MADDTTKVVLDLDNSEFVSKLQESLGLLGDFGGGDSLSPLMEKLASIGEVTGVLAVGFLAFKTALDLTTEGEKIEQINQSFEKLAESVGLSASTLKNGLLEATKGLVSETDLLQAANQAIVKMGDNAGRIPEIMELARKATTVFGGDLISNFNQLSSALSAGNAKMLRHYGIVIDATKAQDDYAKSLGVGREYLDDTGKRMAVMNAALEQGKEKFKDINDTTMETTNALKRIGVSFTEIKEVAALAWNEIAGPKVKSLMTEAAETVHGWATYLKGAFGHGQEQATARIEYLQNEIKYLGDLAELQKKNGSASDAAFSTQRLKQYQDELDRLNQSEQKNFQLKQNQATAAQAAANAEKKEDAGEQKQKGIDYVKLTKDREKFENDLIKLTKERVASEEKIVNTEAGAESVENQKIIEIRKAASQKIEEIDKQQLQKGVINKQQFAKATSEINKKADADVFKIEQDMDKKRLAALKNYAEQNKKTATGITASWKYQSKVAEQNFKDMNKLGEKSFGAMKTHAVSAFEAIGNGSQSAGDALKGFFFGSIGDTAIAQGTEMLLSGIWPPNPIAIAGGGAMIAFGSALKSAGTSSGSSVPSADTSGSGGASAVSAAATTQPTPSPTAGPKSSVSINFAGHYFDTDQTRTRLVQMIRDSSDATDFQFKTIGTP